MIVLLLAFCLPGVVIGSCVNNEDCQGESAFCRPDGVCSNNRFEQGCLRQRHHKGWKIRVCNSDDPSDAAERGICRIPELDHMEIRIHGQDWESVFYESWILQIVLSEMLDVPTTIETGRADARLNFYDPDSPFGYGSGDEYDSVAVGTQLIDCRKASRHDDNYQSCAHFVPESWDLNIQAIPELVERQLIEPPLGMGALGHGSWFMPKFTVEKDPTLLNYWGLQGEENRRKLARTFLRPTTWKDYCNEVSTNNCTSDDDGVAKRAPADEEEAERMFVEGLYTGHFRNTSENDCDSNPECTGHIADYPCNGWSGVMAQQIYWLNISLKSSGSDVANSYSYTQLKDMWFAANATKSDVVLQWWTPDQLYQLFQGTDNELVRVTLPAATQECLEHRTPNEDRCSEDLIKRVGDSRGSCAEPAQAIKKLIATGLRDATYDPSIPEAVRSPGYETLRFFSISTQQVAQLFDYAANFSTPREGICQWVVDNFDHVKRFIPRTYPRVLQAGDHRHAPLLYTATSVAAISCLLVLYTGWLVFRQRHRRVLQFAQVEFLFLILGGLFTISMGAVVFSGAPVTDATCIASMWLFNVGVTLELIPLIVKVAAINKLMRAAAHMKRAIVTRRSLFGAVIVITLLVIVYLACWTALDPPGKFPEYHLTDTTTEDGHTIVLIQYHCDSSNPVWLSICVAFNAVLLIAATVLAYQTRRVRQDFNESQTLAIMIYSHGVFVVLRIIPFFLDQGITTVTLAGATSLLFSLDVLVTLFLYFYPKFVTPDNNPAIRLTNVYKSLFQRIAGPRGGEAPPQLEESSHRLARPSAQSCCGVTGQQQKDAAKRFNILCQHCGEIPYKEHSLRLSCLICGDVQFELSDLLELDGSPAEDNNNSGEMDTGEKKWEGEQSDGPSLSRRVETSEEKPALTTEEDASAPRESALPSHPPLPESVSTSGSEDVVPATSDEANKSPNA